MNQTVMNMIGLIFTLIIIASILHIVMTTSKTDLKDIQIEKQQRSIQGDNLTVMWRTSAESDGRVAYSNGADWNIEQEDGFSQTHSITLYNVSGALTYNISSCTPRGHCTESTNHTVIV